MNLHTGGFRGLVVAAATEVTGTASGTNGVTVAIVAGTFGLLAAIATAVIPRLLDRNRNNNPDAALIDMFRDSQKEVHDLRIALDRERRKR